MWRLHDAIAVGCSSLETVASNSNFNAFSRWFVGEHRTDASEERIVRDVAMTFKPRSSNISC